MAQKGYAASLEAGPGGAGQDEQGAADASHRGLRDNHATPASTLLALATTAVYSFGKLSPSVWWNTSISILLFPTRKYYVPGSV